MHTHFLYIFYFAKFPPGYKPTVFIFQEGADLLGFSCPPATDTASLSATLSASIGPCLDYLDELLFGGMYFFMSEISQPKVKQILASTPKSGRCTVLRQYDNSCVRCKFALCDKLFLLIFLFFRYSSRVISKQP